MIVRKYEDDDFAVVRDWAATGWGSRYKAEQFPKTGFIVDEIAAVFLYSTDSTICFIENMISNPFSNKEERLRAIDLLIEAAFKEAKELGFEIAHATTDLGAVIAHGIRHGTGFKTKQTLLTKNLIDPSI